MVRGKANAGVIGHKKVLGPDKNLPKSSTTYQHHNMAHPFHIRPSDDESAVDLSTVFAEQLENTKKRQKQDHL